MSQSPKVDALAQFLDQTQQVLSAESAGCEREWAQDVGDALDFLQVALRKHRQCARRLDGPFAEIDQTRPSLVRQAEGLRSDYDDFLGQLLALRVQVRCAAELCPVGGRSTMHGRAVDVNAIREQAEQILAGLQKDRQAETNLVLESVTTDLGVGD